MNKFLSSIDMYTNMGRNDTVCIHQLMAGIHIRDISWLSKHMRIRSSGSGSGSTESTMQTDATLDGMCGSIGKEENKWATQCMIEFTYWLYFSFINPLISTCFYATEGEGCGQQVLYYRKPVWSQCMRLGRQQMKRHFVEVQLQPSLTGLLGFQRSSTTLTNSTINGANNNSSSSGAKQAVPSHTLPTRHLHKHSKNSKTTNNTYRHWSKLQQLAFKRLPSVRYLPKKSSLRPITNLKRPSTTANTTTNTNNNNNNTYIDRNNNNIDVITNTMLYSCLHVLKHIYQLNPVLGGFGVMGTDEIYAKFRHYKTGLRTKYSGSVHSDSGSGHSRTSFSATANERKDVCGSDSDGLPQLYMATLDLEKCYDNVDTVRLYDIVQNLITEYNHTLHQPVSQCDPVVDTGASIRHDINAAKLVRDRAPTSGTAGRSAYSTYNKVNTSTGSTTGGGAGTGTGRREEGPDDHVILHKYTVTHYMKSLERPVSRPVRQITCLGDIVPIKGTY